ncbi:MAG: bifunctional diaminohydroxyphosphoribosylaminopyrimidine deaminase/5-amino-6-(5-phosphoribosylamino)uracil reductase RibD [Burkholderiales bacterium]|nr:bifunctional diaminohydroxyphosphoribosylaminopyrimidine deaminase/5-amino-6-(5-phosphoribosylamino)uracil reductase RibD [Burkholderiales bacterium]
MWSDSDRAHMASALDLAARGLFTATPNPRVGCVIARGDAVIAQGFHTRAGEAHAEAEALADARRRGVDVRGATLYVTLEPCNAHGRVAPCVDAVLAAGIARVVAAVGDPNPHKAGGAQRLRREGVQVDVGLLADEARELNPGFFSVFARQRPWVRAKIAGSLDGRTATAAGQSQWITSVEARADGHFFRARACAVLTGIGTVRSDDPALTVRAVDTPRQPRRVVVDRNAQTPPSARVLQGGALMVTAGARNPEWAAGVDVLALPDAQGRIDLPALMRELARRDVLELHVEAGARLTGALLEADLVDELLLYVAPAIMGDPARGMFERRAPLASVADMTRFAWGDVRRVGPDVRLIARRVGES